jgi:hypothetical protein
VIAGSLEDALTAAITGAEARRPGSAQEPT